MQDINTAGTNILETGSVYQQDKDFWTVRKWFTFLIAFLLAWVGCYLFVHQRTDYGYIYVKFSAQQLSQINRILFAQDEYAEEPVATGIDTSAHTLVNDIKTFTRDTSVNDTTALSAAKTSISKPVAVRNKKCDDSCRVNNAMLYIRSEFDDKIKESQLAIIKASLGSFSTADVGVYLADVKLRVKSYFWLTGPWVYLEVIFWVIIGVVCNVLFMLSNDLRLNNGNFVFKPNEIPYHLAKLLYAPFCTIIIVLTYNYIKHRNVVEVNTNEGMIVFSFIAGLFAGRVMITLEKFKDVLFPENIFTSPPHSNTQRSGISIGTGVLANSKPPIEKIPFKTFSHIEFDFSDDDDNNMNGHEEVIAEIKEAVIDLKLDTSGLYEEEKSEILGKGFDSAIVTLHNVNGRDVITAKSALSKGRLVFIANNVRSGIYIVRVTITQHLSNDHTVNLFGEKTAYFTLDNMETDLYLKKYEAID